ncbi:hypothetical protein TorRG33x02_173100 [Trema orientale]|uniref:Disease resistance N-terminal domain-containing protein n=1 Tax=Trema orientale TaxID=63057 RepID=A0A2P5EN18_TREOI|nr:hypothetical protein TorRG33x02_173100 [Trema orientale]
MLSSLTAVLDNAELEQISNRGVKEWLDELQESVYDVEDIVGETEYDALRLKVEAEFGNGSTNKVTNFFSTVFNNSTTDRERKTKMEDILDRLEYIEKRKVFWV